jgi:hypothetical protein
VAKDVIMGTMMSQGMKARETEPYEGNTIIQFEG